MHKLPQVKIDAISHNLLLLKEYVPCEFARKPRHLKYVKNFKAIEFRQFILYTGIIALKNIVSQDVYLNFLSLHIAITILNNPFLCKNGLNLDYAKILLEKFVKHFEQLYGSELVSYNIHNLLHLVDDVRKYGELENFSAFRFENFIKLIKSLIRKGNQPLQQLMRRCAEIEEVKTTKEPYNINKCIQLSLLHNQGPLPHDDVNVLQYKCATFGSFKINCQNSKDSCILIDNQYIINAINFVQYEDGHVLVVGKEMKVLRSFYDVPCLSTEFNINMCKEKTVVVTFNIQQISAKLCKLPYKDYFVTIPILHTYSENRNN